jgi:uncharacterized protein YegJ (DUF2314 family)
MPILVLIVVLVILAFVLFRYLQGKSLPETLTQVDPNAPEMLAAIYNAQKTLPYFWDKHASAINPEDYLVKVRFEGPERAESIWIGDIAVEDDLVSGVVDQCPAFLEFKDGDRIRTPLSNINDWMYSESNKIHGNYTARVMPRPQNMSKRQFDAIKESFAPLPTFDNDQQ